MGTPTDASYLNALAPIGTQQKAGSSGSLGPFAELPSAGGPDASWLDSASENSVANVAAKTTDKGYRALVSRINITSYSILNRLHTCARAFALDKIKATRELKAALPEPRNIDFVYGHSVGAGVQGLMAAGNSLDAGLLAQFISWKAPFEFGTEELYARKRKTITTAAYAVMKFHELLKSHEILKDYDVVDVVVRGVRKPAVELTFVLDTEDGYHYYGHIDVVVRNRITGHIAVMELKTDGRKVVEPAAYGNSDQALGYSVLLDSTFPGMTDFDVIYCVWLPAVFEWEVLLFHKTLKKKAEWVQTLLLDHGAITQYRNMGFFPKRGANCIQYNRRCQWYGECDFIRPEQLTALPIAANSERVEDVDFEFTLSQVIAHQRAQQ